MHHDREGAFKDYLVNPLDCLKPTMITFGIFSLLFGIASLEGDREMLLGGIVCALVFSVAIFLFTVPKLLRQRKASFTELRARNLWDAALEDFDRAQEVRGIGKLGNRFFFGYNTGVVADLTEVIRIDWFSITEEDSEGHKHTTHSIRFFMDHSMKVLCIVRSGRKRKQAGEMLALLKGRCPFGDDLLQKFPEFRG